MGHSDPLDYRSCTHDHEHIHLVPACQCYQFCGLIACSMKMSRTLFILQELNEMSWSRLELWADFIIPRRKHTNIRSSAFCIELTCSKMADSVSPKSLEYHKFRASYAIRYNANPLFWSRELVIHILVVQCLLRGFV
jgi:hypothetical protein